MASGLVRAYRKAEHVIINPSRSFISPRMPPIAIRHPRCSAGNNTTTGAGAGVSATGIRLFSSSGIRKDYHFDTHHFVQRLEREGLTRPQAEGIMTAMAQVIDESIRTMTHNMVTKSEQEKVRVVALPGLHGA